MKTKNLNRKLIINADDFGMLDEINKGVIEGVRRGVITSISTMINMPGSDEAVRYLKKKKNITSGVHLVITEGKPILPLYKVSSIVNSDGQFYSWPIQIFRIMVKVAKTKEIEAEFTAQICDYIHSIGRFPSHVDSHHHIHLYPSVFPIVVRLAKKFKIRAIRCGGSNFFNIRTFWPPSLRKIIIRFLFGLHQKQIHSSKLLVADFFVDMAWNKTLKVDSLLNLIKRFPGGTTELSCHPARIGKFEAKNSPFLNQRQQELDVLLSNRVVKKLLEFEKTNYQALVDNHEYKINH